MADPQSRSLLSSGAEVWDRSGTDSLSRRAFLGLIGGLTFYGLALNAVLATWAMQVHFQPGLVLMLVLALGLPLAGIFIARRAQSVPVALLGYHLLLVPMGLILGPILSVYINIGGMAIVTRALMLTGCTVGVMTLLGLSYPDIFAKLGGVLFASLLALVALRLISFFVPSLAAAGWVDWLAAGIFTLYIGYDCHRAMSIPATGRNSVDVAISLYLDIYNLFLTILRLLSRRD
ncbi:MAG: Bax inhibitor-1/YccA family protein [Acidobacteriota bacterium]|nr:Bax inhibitor-1/YccA family protein [Acidobacteriota bacterium]